MTKEEFIEKYGDVKMRFSYSDKYESVFRTTLLNGNKLACSRKRDGDGNSKFKRTPNEITVRELDPSYGVVYSEIFEKLESFGEPY